MSEIYFAINCPHVAEVSKQQLLRTQEQWGRGQGSVSCGATDWNGEEKKCGQAQEEDKLIFFFDIFQKTQQQPLKFLYSHQNNAVIKVNAIYYVFRCSVVLKQEAD